MKNQEEYKMVSGLMKEYEKNALGWNAKMRLDEKRSGLSEAVDTNLMTLLVLHKDLIKVAMKAFKKMVVGTEEDASDVLTYHIKQVIEIANIIRSPDKAKITKMKEGL